MLMQQVGVQRQQQIHGEGAAELRTRVPLER